MGQNDDFRRIPPGNRSPYGMGKMEPPKKPPTVEARREEVAPVQGCGDPNCNICLAQRREYGRAAGAQLGGNGGTNNVATSNRLGEMQALMNAMRNYSVRDDSVFTIKMSTDADEEKPNPRAALEQAEREAREPIKDYLLETEHQVAWDDVIGNETAKATLLEAIEHPVKFKELYAHYAKKPLKGVMLFGPPGCGKTMLAKASATALAKVHGVTGKATMIAINGPDIQTPYVGQTEAVIRAIFAYARAFKALHGYPLLVFIDEAEAILPSRDASSGARRAMPWEESQVATFLGEMDGMEDSGAFVMLATNRPQAIDAALLREGRCDRKVKVERPNDMATAEILRASFKGAPMMTGLGVTEAARYGMSELFRADRGIIAVSHGAEKATIMLADLLSGAMVVGLSERAKALAMQRDMQGAGAPIGVTAADIGEAVNALYREQAGMNHDYAIREFLEAKGWRENVRLVPIKPGEIVEAPHPHGCLHCAIVHAITAWDKAHNGGQGVQLHDALGNLAKAVGGLIADAPVEMRPDLLAITGALAAEVCKVEMADGRIKH